MSVYHTWTVLTFPLASAVTAIGDFDLSKGGQLVLWDCQLLVEFPLDRSHYFRGSHTLKQQGRCP